MKRKGWANAAGRDTRHGWTVVRQFPCVSSLAQSSHFGSGTGSGAHCHVQEKEFNFSIHLQRLKP